MPQRTQGLFITIREPELIHRVRQDRGERPRDGTRTHSGIPTETGTGSTVKIIEPIRQDNFSNPKEEYPMVKLKLWS